MTISALPELDPGDPPRPRRRVVRVAAAALAVALVVAGIAVATSGADSPSYRTATASVRDVDALFSTVATIEPVSQASVGFPVAGTVETVAVGVGDTVTVGQTLATLDTASLEQAVRAAQASLDQANLALSSALAGEPVSSDPGAGSSNVAPASTDTSSAERPTVAWASSTQTSPSRTPATKTTIGDAQLAVVEAQRAVDSALQAADAALAAAERVCEDQGTSTSTTSTTSTTAVPSTGSSACLSALAQVQHAQQAVATAQQQLADAASALTTMLDEQDGSVPGQGGADDPSGVAPNESGSTGPSGSAGAPSNGAPSNGEMANGRAADSTASPEQLIALQRTVSAAELQLAVAEQAVAQATIVSPIEGTVVASSIQVGATVTAGSSTDVVTIDGEGGFEATTTVGVDDVAGLEIGQLATLRPDGADVDLDAEVVSIGLVGDGSDGTYRVTAGLTGSSTDTSLRNGGTGALTIVTGATTQALAVPTSAVTTSDGASTVTVLDDAGEATSVTVRVGVVGAEWTEIIDGLDGSATVVLADLGEPLPGSATEVDEQQRSPGGFTFPGDGRGFPTGGPPSGAMPGGPPGG